MNQRDDYNSTSKRVIAHQHYEQALLMICDGRIQEAVQELEEACHLQPACEVYQETLAQLKMSCNLSYSEAANSEQHQSDTGFGTSQPASEVPLNTNCDTGYATYSKRKAARFVNGTATPNGQPVTKRGFKKSSPIDGLSHIELPEIDQNLPSSGKFEREHVTAAETIDNSAYRSPGMAYIHTTSNPCSSVPMDPWTLPGVSCHLETVSGTSFEMDHSGGLPSSKDLEREDLDDFFQDRASERHPDFDPDKSFDERFLEQLCKARESDEGCDKYYHEFLDESCSYNLGPVLPDLNFGLSSSSKDFCGVDDFDDEEYFCSHLGKGRVMNTASSSEPSSVKTAETFAKPKDTKDLHKNTQDSDGKTQKERVYFVNGACYTSSHPPKNTHHQTTENGSAESATEKQQKRGAENLSQSERDFYRNLNKYYFGSGKVKYKKEMPKEKEGGDTCIEETKDTRQKDKPTDGIFVRPAKQSLGVQEEKPSQRTVQHDLNGKVEDYSPAKDHLKSKIDCTLRNLKPSGVESRVKAEAPKRDSKTSQTSHSTTADPSCDPERKLPVHGSKIQDKVHKLKGQKPAFPEQTGRRHKGRLRQKGKVLRGATVNSPSFDQEMQTAQSWQYDASDEPPKLQSKQTDFRGLQVWLQKSGKQLITSCGQTAMSVFQYMMVLAMLLTFGFLIFPLSHACNMVCKVCSVIMEKVKELSTSLRNVLGRKILPWFAWLMEFIIRLLMYFDWFKNLCRSRSAKGERINLSMTGDEAVQKMLTGKGNDPYSILGVPRDASEDDIRKHYRKLAVLIHPDKNGHPQAEEAFKVLADAFAQIGTTEKRMEYDMQEACKRRDQDVGDEKNSPRTFFSELHKHMTEMQNYLSCDACGGKHRRYKTDRPVLFARFCSQCDTHHAAKQGELWAETKLLGMKFYFFARIDDAIYDVTEWAACHGLHQGRILTDSHVAPWKIKTQSNQRYPFKSEEELVDDFLREMFFGHHFPPGTEKSEAQYKPRKRKRKKRK